MSNLIPRLSDLLFRHCGFSVPQGFAESYVKLHDSDWYRAQDHWERVVVRVLNSTAVPESADDEQAMRIAVTAAATGLHNSPLRTRCSLCVSEGRPS
ncbi:DUF6313 family protein [Actinocorallia sp. A-T 12471]|nr:DUF6313 family protein [Actinocorallia sp. A-T 12471]MDX6740182.1 DUF6313 family protein [Actinocorallia sp. A-T 12471]